MLFLWFYPLFVFLNMKNDNEKTKKKKAKITYEIASNKISYLIHSTYKMQEIMYKQKYKP